MNIKLTSNLGMLFLAIWLILSGLLPLLNMNPPGYLLHLLAIVAGILILIGR